MSSKVIQLQTRGSDFHRGKALSVLTNLDVNERKNPSIVLLNISVLLSSFLISSIFFKLNEAEN